MRGGKPLLVALEAPAGAAGQCVARAAEAGKKLLEVGDDEAAGGGRRRRAPVRGEIAERRVLLVADRRNDGNRALDDRTHDALVGEREESSKLPPPRARMTTSTSGSAAIARSASHMAAAARCPWTSVSATTIRAGGKRVGSR